MYTIEIIAIGILNYMYITVIHAHRRQTIKKIDRWQERLQHVANVRIAQTILSD